MWIALFVLATVLLTLSMRVLIVDNPHDAVPWVGAAPVQSGRAVALRLLGAGAAAVAIFVVPAGQLVVGLVVLLLVFVPGFVLQWQHNRAVSSGRP